MNTPSDNNPIHAHTTHRPPLFGWGSVVLLSTLLLSPVAAQTVLRAFAQVFPQSFPRAILHENAHPAPPRRSDDTEVRSTEAAQAEPTTPHEPEPARVTVPVAVASFVPLLAECAAVVFVRPAVVLKRQPHLTPSLRAPPLVA